MNFLPLIAPPFYTGTELTITCDAFVPQSIYVDANSILITEVALEKDGMIVSSGGRFTIGDLEYFSPAAGDTQLYRSMITISPLVRTSDIGQWICIVTFNLDDAFVIPSSFSSDYSLNEVEVPGKRVELYTIFCEIAGKFGSTLVNY